MISFSRIVFGTARGVLNVFDSRGVFTWILQIRVTFLYDEVKKGFQLGITQPSGRSGRSSCQSAPGNGRFHQALWNRDDDRHRVTRSFVIKTCSSLQSFFYGLTAGNV